MVVGQTIAKSICILFSLLCLLATVPSASENVDIDKIRKTFDEALSTDTILNQNYKIFCKLYNYDKLIQVSDTTDWPEAMDIDITYNILYDSAGNILLFREIPISRSGDWRLTRTHHFSSQGNLMWFESDMRQFSTCDAGISTFLLCDLWCHYYSEDGELVAEIRSFTDADQNVIDTSGCLPPRVFDSPKVYGTVDELVTGLGLWE